MDQPDMNQSHVEGYLVTGFEEEIYFFENIVVVQQPSVEDTPFYF